MTVTAVKPVAVRLMYGSPPVRSVRTVPLQASPFATASTVLSALLIGKLPTGPGPGPVGAAEAASGGCYGPAGALPPAQLLAVRSALVPDVPAWLQDAAQPNGDLFSLVRRAGGAGGVSSVIALVAEPLADNAAAAAADIAAAAAAAAAAATQSATRTQPSPGRVAVANMVSGPVAAPGKSYGISSGSISRLGMAARRDKGSEVGLEGIETLGPADPRMAAAAATGGGGGGAAAAITGGGTALGPTVLGVYLCSGLSLPPSFLQVARDRALALLQVVRGLSGWRGNSGMGGESGAELGGSRATGVKQQQQQQPGDEPPAAGPERGGRGESRKPTIF